MNLLPFSLPNPCNSSTSPVTLSFPANAWLILFLEFLAFFLNIF